MGFGNKEVLLSRSISSEHFLNNISDTKFEQIGKEISDLITLKTKITAPENPLEAPGYLQGVWADLLLWKITEWQSDLPEEEIQRRLALRKDAMNILDDIESGKTETTTPVEQIKIKGNRRIYTP